MKLMQWLIPWESSYAIVIVTSVTSILYIQGCKLNKPIFRRQLYFWFGLLSLYFVSQTQFDYYAQHEFFVHQLQSLVLHHWGPFFIMMSNPKAILSAGLFTKANLLLQIVADWKPVQLLVKVLANPVVEVILFVGLLIFWLLPSVHFIAMLDWRLYRLMNWSMVLNGLMFWGLVINSHSALSPGCRIVMMLAVIPPQILIGVLIFFTSYELYPIYALCGQPFTGVSSITDQHIGGLILWTQGAMMSVIGILIVIHQELRQRKHILNPLVADK
jgi:putative membrane protein